MANVDDNDDVIYTGATISLWNLKFIGVLCLIESMCPGLYFGSVFTTTNNVTTSKRPDENSTQFFNQHSVKRSSLFSSMNHLTITEEFNLVDEDDWLSDMYTYILNIGFIIGSVFMGLGDTYGRLCIIRVGSCICFLAFLMIGHSPNLYVVLFGRLLMGITMPIISTSAFTLCIETIPLRYRSWLGFLGSLSNYLFFILMGVAAYYIRQWRILHLVIGSSVYILPFFTALLDESPRWLIHQHQYEDACNILMKIPSNKKISKEALIKIIMFENQSNASKNNSDDIGTKNVLIKTKQCMRDLFGSWDMCKLSIGLPFLWFLMAISCFGIPLFANRFTENIYQYIIIIGGAQIPSVFTGPLLVNKFGNIKSISMTFMLLGIVLIWTLSVSVSLWWLKWVLIAIGMNLSATINCLFKLVTSELIPTSLRTTYFGICNVAFYGGFFLATYITNMSSIWWLYITISLITCSIAACFVNILPETHGMKLQNNIEELSFQVEDSDIEKNQLKNRRKTV